jgi:hypothetical protein
MLSHLFCSFTSHSFHRRGSKRDSKDLPSLLANFYMNFMLATFLDFYVVLRVKAMGYY